jgi:Ankyrin repeats (3 copies)
LGRLPLHLSAQHYGVEETQFLLAEWRPALRERSNDGSLPLHVAASTSAPIAKMKLLVEAYLEALQARTNDGSLPLHVAAQEYSTPRKTIEWLVDQHPRALDAKTNSGRLPLHVALKHQSCEAVPHLLHRNPVRGAGTNERRVAAAARGGRTRASRPRPAVGRRVHAGPARTDDGGEGVPTAASRGRPPPRSARRRFLFGPRVARIGAGRRRPQRKWEGRS